MIAAAVGCLVIAGSVVAADEFVVRKSTQAAGERYVPGVWVDPDGCEHWVMDDGVEGCMTPHVWTNTANQFVLASHRQLPLLATTKAASATLSRALLT